MMLFNDEAASDMILNNYKNLSFGQQKLDDFGTVIQLLVNTKSIETFKKGVDVILQFRDQIPGNYKDQFVPYIEGTLSQVQKAKASRGEKEQAEYLLQKLNTKKAY
jgi:aminopeptidase N